MIAANLALLVVVWSWAASVQLGRDLGNPLWWLSAAPLWSRLATWTLARGLRFAAPIIVLLEVAIAASGRYPWLLGLAPVPPLLLCWLMQAVASPHFRLNLDNSHFEVMGRDMDEYLPQLAPFAVHTDLKDQRGRSPDHEFLVPGEGTFDYPRYLRALDGAGYDGYLTVEISIMVQRRPDYDPAEVATRSFQTLIQAAHAANVLLEHRGASVGAP